MESIPHTPGIYQWLCVPTGKVYVGSAVDLRKRWRDHRNALCNNTHENHYLQRAWNKYGELAFEFSVLERVMFVEYLLDREQFWLDKTRCYERAVGFNMARVAGSSKGVVASEQRKERIAVANARTFTGFIDPSGNEVEPIHNLTAFCRELSLGDQAMHEVYRGTRVSYKGWTHKNYPRQAHGLSKTYHGFIDPSGNPVGPIHNLSAFCRQNGLAQSHMQQVFNGNRPHHKGWTYKRGDDGL
jgi:group I intron endonuclease